MSWFGLLARAAEHLAQKYDNLQINQSSFFA